MIFLHVMIMVLALIMELANVKEASTVTVAQVNMILCYWCFHLVVCQISDMYHKNRMYLQKFLSFITRGTKNYGNTVIFFYIFVVSFISKKCIGINCSTNWIGIVYKVKWLRLDMNENTIFFKLIFFRIFLLLYILLVLCNNSTECSDHGTCGDDGKCICHDGYYSSDCSSKLILFSLF